MDCKKRRKSNWTEEDFSRPRKREIQYLKDRVQQRDTNKLKNEVWQCITNQVNAASTEERTVLETKKKFEDLKAAAKKKANWIKNSSNRTGGGEPTSLQLTPVEEAIVFMIGSDAVYGLKGLDSSNCTHEDHVILVDASVPVQVANEGLTVKPTDRSTPKTMKRSDCSREKGSGTDCKEVKRPKMSHKIGGQDELFEIERERLSIEKQ
ncbi:uncharacterized protein LOC141898983 [Tubulanus polymorphus]|uniref:uncharacterized protein LOC141898983 n=1 Tax=Tubulanus polymorphus TaxID=672921 RepID=UPI003DA4541C